MHGDFLMPRWNLSIPEETDLVVRAFLGRSGGKKGDLSRFVNDAVRRRVFDLAVDQIKERNATFDQQEILDMVEEEVTAARASRSCNSTMSTSIPCSNAKAISFASSMK